MANEWLRLWHDMPTDPKWRTISRISKQPISLVIATYTHLLVTASRNVTRGHADVTTEDLASALDVTDEDIQAVLDAMQGRVLDGNKLTGWDSRQPKREDVGNAESGAMSATERKRLQRSRNKSNVTDVTKNVTCHEMSQNSHEISNSARDIYIENSPDISSQLVDKKDMSRMSHKVTTDKDKDKDKETTVLQADEKKIEPQVSGMFWVTFFVNEKGFQIHEAQTATTVPMFVDWVKRGVTNEDVELAMIAAHNKLGGGRPNNPTYYRNFVEAVMIEKQKSQLDRAGSETGFQENSRGNYATKTNNNEARNGAGRKLSLVEQAQRDCERLEERERREQGERERVIN